MARFLRCEHYIYHRGTQEISRHARRIVLRMQNSETETGFGKAVSFLLSRIAEQASKEAIPLTGIELKQLSFSEETASAEEIAAAKDFDVANDSDQFEEKIAQLLRHAFDDDVQNGKRVIWEKHLAALRDHDIYVLVMVDEAGISRPKAKVNFAVPLRMRPLQLIRWFPDAVAGLVALCGFVYFVIFHIGSSHGGPPLFGNLADKLISSERVQGTLLLVWIGSMLWLWFRVKDFR